MDPIVTFAGALVAVLIIYLGQWVWPRPRTVHHNERALLLNKGRLVGEVGPGRYWLRKGVGDLSAVDCRRRQTVVSGQEVLTEDRVAVKVSMIAEFTVTDVTKALTSVEDFEAALYGRIQLALREVVSSKELDAALVERGEIGGAVHARVSEAATELGVELHDVQVRDFMLAAGLRNAYSEVFEARQKGLAALERARGESAALRSLANVAGQLDRNPGLIQLRLLHAIESGAGSKIIVSLDPGGSAPSVIEATGEGE